MTKSKSKFIGKIFKHKIEDNKFILYKVIDYNDRCDDGTHYTHYSYVVSVFYDNFTSYKTKVGRDRYGIGWIKDSEEITQQEAFMEMV